MTTPDNKASPVEPGTVLAGKYRVERVIGQGGMGVVVEAKHIALDERVAMKFLIADYAQHPEASARFLREARAAVKIKSEHVARVSDVGTLENGAPYMVMELLQGNDLSKELQTKGPLQMQDAVDYIVQACDAIAEAHSAGIVHRDLKPANLFLARRVDASPLVKVLDFGISKTAESSVENLTKTMTAMGSALYMSPEQMQQTRGVDHRTDIYALGVALYELLAGKQPYYADTLPQLCAEVLTGTPTPLATVRPDLPPELAPVIEKAYARDRADRYPSIAHFVVALAPFAPSRSQPVIERVARVANLPVPTAGVPAAKPAPAPVPAGGPLLAGGGTIAMDPPPRSPFVGGGTMAIDPPTGPARAAPPAPPPPPGQGGQYGTTPAGGYGAAPGGQSATPPGGYGAAPGGQSATPPGGYGAAPGGQSSATPPGGYGAAPGGQSATPPGGYDAAPGGQSSAPAITAPNAPVITAPNAPATAPNMEVALAAPRAPAASRVPVYVGMALALLGGGAAAYFAARTPSQGPATALTVIATSTAAAGGTSTAAPAQTSVPVPTATATATPESAPSADPTSTAKAAVSGKPAASTKPATGGGAAASSKPSATAKPKSIFDDR